MSEDPRFSGDNLHDPEANILPNITLKRLINTVSLATVVQQFRVIRRNSHLYAKLIPQV